MRRNTGVNGNEGAEEFSISLPVTPVIPPQVIAGQTIRAAHENQVVNALSDLWTDVQALGLGAVPSTRRITVNAPLTGGGTLAADIVINLDTSGLVPTSRKVIAGTGLSGGGDLTADRTFSVNVAAITAGIQTPWLQDISGNGHSLSTVMNITASGQIICTSFSASGSANAVSYAVASYSFASLASAGKIAVTCDTITATGVVNIGGQTTVTGQIINVAPHTYGLTLRQGNYPNVYLGADTNGSLLISDNAGNPHITILQSGQVGINVVPSFPVHILQGNPASAATATQIVIQDGGNNPGYRLQLGFYVQGGTTWTGALQALAGGSGVPLVLNALGGNVGIGTVSPSVLLEVAGALRAVSVTATNTMVLTGAASTYRVMYFQTGAGGNRFSFGINDTAETGGNAGSNLSLLAYSDAGAVTFPLTVNRASGNVGIGTTTPNSLLHLSRTLSGGAGPVIILDNPANAISDAAAIRFQDSGQQRCELRMSIEGAPYGADFIFLCGLVTQTEQFRITQLGQVKCPSLQSTNPGAGSKQLWYDPADGNRVKFAA